MADQPTDPPTPAIDRHTYTVGAAGETLAAICSRVSGGRVAAWPSLVKANPDLVKANPAVATDPFTIVAANTRLTVPADLALSGLTAGPAPIDDRVARFVRGSAANLRGRSLLQAPVASLNGVTDAAAAEVHRTLRVRSIFDLAASRVFTGAFQLLRPGDGSRASASAQGFVPSDLILGDPSDLREASDLLDAGIEEIDFANGDIVKSGECAQRLKTALGVETIRDLALWPPFQAARELVRIVFDPGTPATDDSGTPSALVPSTGNFATERVYYRKVVMQRKPPASAAVAREHTQALERFAVDVELRYGYPAYREPALGARFTIEQAWYARGLALGHLLHSVTLAPGESTRIAVVDWARRTAGSQQEDTTQLEELASVGEQARAISEVSNAVAHELQHGESTTRSQSTTGQIGATGALGSFIGLSGGLSSNTGLATSVSTTAGDRQVAADVLQRAHEVTQQHATSARGRRAAIIVETSQAEHEVASTRVLTNYNHMHALTMQYYEVLQVYRAVTRTVRVEPLLFVPLYPIQFDPQTISSSIRVLVAAALADTTDAPGLASWRERIARYTTRAVLVMPEPGYLSSDPPAEYRDLPQDCWPAQSGADPATMFPDVLNAELTAVDIRTIAGAGASTVDGMYLGANPFPMPALADHMTVPLNPPLVLYQEAAIGFSYVGDPSTWKQTRVTYHVKLKDGHEIELTHFVDPPSGDAVPKDHPHQPFIAVRLAVSSEPEASVEVEKHINQHAMHYSAALWSYFGSSLPAVLGGYTYDNKNLLDIIDPKPVAVTENLLGFRLTDSTIASDAAFLKSDVAPVESELSLPTGGVFAEAVLGRANAAEKLDLTRFWNWQDSPIPILPPDIAPVSMGSRAQPMDLSSHGLETQAAKLPDLPRLPDPTGMQAVIQALTANIFRDMSNAGKTAEAVEKALALSADGANKATDASVAAYKAALEHQREMMRTAVDAAKTLLPMIAPEAGAASTAGSLLGGATSGGGSLSKAGAIMNAAQSLDARQGGSDNQQAAMEGLTGRPVGGAPAAAEWFIPELASDDDSPTDG